MAIIYTVMIGCSVLLALLLVLPIAHGETVDCYVGFYSYSTNGYSVCNYWFYDGVYNYFQCGPGLECCDDNHRSCCYSGTKEELYSTGELLGLILCSSALVMTGFLTLVICCATVCNNKDDKTAWQKS